MSAIELALRFPPLARRPDIRRWGRRWDVCVDIDGEVHVREEGPRHRFEVEPGPHEVSVWFRGAGVAILARPVRFGLRSVRVEIPADAVVALTYHGSTFWHLGGFAELRVEPPPHG